VAPDPLAGYTDALGFSLKPPKFIRKAASAVKKAVTIKNVAKVAAIAGAVALAPVAGPAILAAGKFVVGKAGALLAPLIHRNAPATATAPPIDFGPLLPSTDAGQTAPMLGPGAIPLPPTGGPVPVPGTVYPDQASTIGPPVPPGLTATVPPSPGDTYGPPVPEAHSNAALIGGVALLAVFAMASRRRRKGR
jgi:hypothetical protein